VLDSEPFPNRQEDGAVEEPVIAAPREQASTSLKSRNRRGEPVPPRTDVGTIVIHWGTVAAFVISLFTGIRIASDNYGAKFSQWLSPILPTGEVWTWHFMAGLALFFFSAAYLIYINRTGLLARNSFRKLRLILIPEAGKRRFEALNVGLHWFSFALIAVMTITGVLLYIGFGGWLVWVHSTSAFIGLAYIFVHVLSHYLQGGWWQLFRVFRPAKLVITRAVRPYPLLAAVLAGAAVVLATVGSDWATRDTLTIIRADQQPILDGIFDEGLWVRARPVLIRTQQGINLSGSGESLVEARAVHDGTAVYFAFKWQDPTRSLRRVPMIKKEDGWHLLHDRADIADVNTFYEDKLAIGFSKSPAFGSGESTYLGEQPLSDKPASLHGRGYHYTRSDDNLMDVWQWKASRGGLLGYVDDQYFASPRQPTPAEAAGQTRYQAGYWNDPGRAFYSYNYVGEPPGGYKGIVKVHRLPKDWKATLAALGKFDLDPDSNDQEGARWWMEESESIPYSAEADAAIPVGTVMPGVLISGAYEGDRAHIRGAARWKDGYWYLETKRDLKTGSKYDQDFVPGQTLYMWVNVFDHTQTRHTRHVRPVRVVTQR
jgi:cytochrome b subunit of formate dehydrogenase